MKKYIITIGCALMAQITHTFAGPTYPTWQDIHREDLQDRKDAAAFNEQEWQRHRR